MFKQIICRRHQDRPDPCVRIGTYGFLFNPAAAEAGGKENTRCVVFYDKEENRLAVTFFKGKLLGSYSFSKVPNSESRRVAVGPFLRRMKILKKLTKIEYPMTLLDEQILGYEGSKVFVINLY